MKMNSTRAQRVQLASLTPTELEVFNCNKQRNWLNFLTFIEMMIGAFVDIFVFACFKSLETPTVIARILSMVFVILSTIGAVMAMYANMKKDEKICNHMQRIANLEVFGNMSDVEKVDKLLNNIKEKIKHS